MDTDDGIQRAEERHLATTEETRVRALAMMNLAHAIVEAKRARHQGERR